MKLSKDDLKNKIGELITDKDLSIQILEDIEDSMDVQDTSEYDNLKSKYDELNTKYDTLQDNYKKRFLEGSSVQVSKEPDSGLSVKQYVDIKEI